MFNFTAVGTQLQQFATLLILLVAGKWGAFVYLSWKEILLLLCAGVLFEHLLLFLQYRKLPFFSFSALSTTIGIMMMLVATQKWIYFVMLAMALLQKHYLHIGNRHLFNPSNFALIMGMLLFYHQAHIVMGQLGDAWWLHLLLGILGMSILWRVDRWVISLAFICFYLFFSYYLVVLYDPVMLFETLYERFYAVSFVLFVLFMLTDPRTTPESRWGQFLFGMAVALGAVLLDRWYGFRVQHLFMILFLLTPLYTVWMAYRQKSTDLWLGVVVLFLVLGAIIYLEMQPPYYYVMDV